MTYFCYIDESGTPELPGTSTHFVLVGVAIPIGKWDEADKAISTVLNKYGLADAEIHTAWMLRKYPEQLKVASFEKLNWQQRKSAVDRIRAGELIRLQKAKPKSYRQAKKTYAHTAAYVHLSYDERVKAISASNISSKTMTFGWLPISLATPAAASTATLFAAA